MLNTLTNVTAADHKINGGPYYLEGLVVAGHRLLISYLIIIMIMMII